MGRKIELHDDDEVKLGDNGLTTSGRVLRLLGEDMFGLTVDWYIRDARLGRAVRALQRRMEEEERNEGHR